MEGQEKDGLGYAEHQWQLRKWVNRDSRWLFLLENPSLGSWDSYVLAVETWNERHPGTLGPRLISKESSSCHLSSKLQPSSVSPPSLHPSPTPHLESLWGDNLPPGCGYMPGSRLLLQSSVERNPLSPEQGEGDLCMSCPLWSQGHKTLISVLLIK